MYALIPWLFFRLALLYVPWLVYVCVCARVRVWFPDETTPSTKRRED